MMVNGPLEIYSTVIGVKLFDDMFNILASMGIVFIPLIILFLDNTTKPFEAEIENGASTALRRVSIHFGLWVITMILLVTPTWPLHVTAITYKPVCTNNAVTSTFGDTGTTYDNVLANLEYNDLKLPIMMAFVLMGTSGFTNAMIASLPCNEDVIAMQNTIDTTRLTPAILRQVNRFENECYAPTKAQFMSHQPELNDYQKTMNDYGGQTDLTWIGSHVFQSLYYTDMYPTSPVPGFPYAKFPYQYEKYNKKNNPNLDTPQWGYPSCQQWWSDDTYGLEKQLVALASAHQPNNPHLGDMSLQQDVKNWQKYMIKGDMKYGAKVTPDDYIAHGVLYDPSNNSGFGNHYTNWMNASENYNPLQGHGVVSDVGYVAAQAGQTVEAVKSFLERREISAEIPIYQAVLLAIALLLGPVIMLFGMIMKRDVQVIFSYYFIVASLMFIPFIEKFLQFLENALHASQAIGMYAMANNMVLYNIFTKLHFFGPLFFMVLMGTAGVGIGSSLDKGMGRGVHGEAERVMGRLIGKLTS